MVYNTAAVGNQSEHANNYGFGWQRILNVVLLLAAAAFAASYLIIGVSRVFYPYDLDFIEDAMLLQAWRVANGLPVFLPPNGEFVPQVYMPLYTWLGGALMRLTGPAFWPLRLLSLFSTLASATMITCIARRIQRDRIIAISCAALFLAGFRLTGGWYELARVDALFLSLLFAGTACAVYGHGTTRGLVASGLLLGLATLSKQNGLFMTGLTLGYLLLIAGRRVGWSVVPFLLIAGVLSLWLEWQSNGWFSYYVVDIAYASPVDWSRALTVLRQEFLGDMGALMFIAGAAATSAVLSKKWLALREEPWLLFIGGGLLVSLAGRSSVGGNLNNLIPGYAFLCLAPALLARELGRRSCRWRAVSRLGLVLGILAQFGLARESGMFRPTSEMRSQGDALIRYVEGLDGEVWVMLHPFYGLAAGKTPGPHIQTLWHARQRGQDPLPNDLVVRIEGQVFTSIISDESRYFETDPELLALLVRCYRPKPLDPALSPPTLSGIVVRPSLEYVPIPGGCQPASL